MRSIENRIDYDCKYDVLYYSILNTDNSYGDDIDGNIVILRDMDTEQITGVTIIGYKKIFKCNEVKKKVLSKYIDINPMIEQANILIELR